VLDQPVRLDGGFLAHGDVPFIFSYAVLVSYVVP
jgi:hypothetical protein